MRLLFIGESGTEAFSSLGEDLTRQAACAQAMAYLDTQWTGDDRQYYQQYYDRGVADIRAFSERDPEQVALGFGQPQPIEVHALLVAVEFGWLMLTT